MVGPSFAVRGEAADSPANRLRVAVVGVNGRGRRLTDVFSRLPGCEVGWVCDVDSRLLDRAAAVAEGAQGKKPETETDFRRLLDNPAVDAVVVVTPDHWHAHMGVWACQAGKHVYVEKPCSHSPREGEILVEAARKHKRVVQMGNQRRSWPMLQEAVELIRNGEIGEVHHARSWYANARAPIGRGRVTDAPDGLDFDLWQGPAPRRPFQDNLIHYNWHWFWHWGTGEAGNNAIHGIDVAIWGLGLDGKHPTRVTSTGGRYYHDDDWETPDTQMLGYEYGDGKKITWEGFSCNRLGAMGSGFGVTFHGSEGSIMIEAGNVYRVYDGNGRELRRVTPESDPADQLAGARYSRDAGHAHDFLECVRNGGVPASDIGQGHISTTAQHLGNIAQRVGRTLECDPANGHILNDPEAAGYWSREYEPGWELKA